MIFIFCALAFGYGSVQLYRRMASDMHKNSPSISQFRHPKFWLEDGSVVVRTRARAFKVHRTLLHRHSRVFPTWSTTTEAIEDCPVVEVPHELGVRDDDMEAFFENLYHDEPLTPSTPFHRVAAVLRVSSPKQLDFPSMHELAQNYIIDMFPSGPQPYPRPEHLEEATLLSLEYKIHPIQKGLLYSLVTTSDFDVQEDGTMRLPHPEQKRESSEIHDQMKPAPPVTVLCPEQAERCTRLMEQIIEHFTPILFTVGTTSHMACTDVFANTWMSLVIQPALENDGVYKPLETLQRISDIDWAAHGMCASCIQEKREEWHEEQENIWNRMDAWLGMYSDTNQTKSQ